MDFNYTDINELVEKINRVHEFSGVVLVKQQGKEAFGKAYGLADRSNEIKNTINTRFGIASGCKIFTAVAIAKLVEKGLISFDTLLKDCLNIEFPNFDKNVTIHELLTHSSGIPDYFDEDIMTDYGQLWEDKPMYSMKKLKDFLPFFQNNKMKFNPGEKFYYNNGAFIVLGLIVEQQSGMTFTEYIEENIFKSCGMKDSGYFSLDMLPRDCAYGYIHDEEKDTWKTNIYSIPIIGGADGGAFTTAEDMSRFWHELLNYKILSQKTTEEILTPQIHVDNNIYYGYGIWINKTGNDILKYQLMGSDPGVSFRSSFYIKENTELTILANKEFGGGIITKEFEKKFL